MSPQTPPHTPARARRLAVAVVLLTVTATGCDTATSEPSTPTAAATTEAQASTPDRAAALDAETAVDLYVAWREVVAGLPPVVPADLEVTDAGEGIVVADSPAAEWITDELTQAIDTGVVDRGDITAEVLELGGDTSGETRTVELCASHDVQPTDLATGESATDDGSTRDRYQRVEAHYQAAAGGGWLLASTIASEPQDCVPPSIDEAVRTNWASYLDADAAWARRGARGDDLGPLADLTTGRRLDSLRDSDGLPGDSWVERSGLAHDLQLRSATRTQVEGSWCVDPARNTDAGLHGDDGTFTPMTELADRHLQRAAWERADGQWRLSELETIQPDQPDAPEEHRCF